MLPRTFLTEVLTNEVFSLVLEFADFRVSLLIEQEVRDLREIRYFVAFLSG